VRRPARRSHSREPAFGMASSMRSRPAWRSPDTRSCSRAMMNSGAR